MKKFMLIAGVMTLLAGFGTAQAAAGTAFLDSVDKSLKISGQMASGKIPYNPARAVKEMMNIQNAVKAFESGESAGAPKSVVSCAAQLKAASQKGAAAAKAGVGAFKAVYGDLLSSYKNCK